MSIERKNSLIPIPYLYANPFYYATLGDYVPRKTYLSLLTRYAHEDLEQIRNGAWWHVIPRNSRLPKCGYKIHLSSALEPAAEMLSLVAKFAIGKAISFKFLVDEVIHELANSKNYSSWSCGKFITVFPKDEEEFFDTVMDLCNILPEGGGPYIHTDRPVPGSKTVFFRYGSFEPPKVVNVFGEYERYLTIEGRRIKDGVLSLVSGNLGETKFFSEIDIEDPIILNNRYTITEVLHSSNAGSVLLAKDLLDDRIVVVKEARHGIVTSGVQATKLLIREYSILNLLKDSGVTPKPIDFFWVANNSFIVMEYIDGIVLSKFRSSPVFSSLHESNPSLIDIRNAYETFRVIWERLLIALQEIHKAGVIIGDLAPQNVMINPATLDIWLIDFEAARYTGDDLDVQVYTIGYQDRNNTAVTTESDLRAHRKVISSLILPVQVGSSLNPLLNWRLVRRFSSDYPDFLDICIQIEPNIQLDDSRHSSLERNEILDGLMSGIKNGIGVAASNYLWACDYRGLNSNPLSMAFGAVGTAPTFSLVGETVPSKVHDWISLALNVDRNYAPGLFMGSSGISWGLMELGRFKEAEQWLRRALNSDLLMDRIDIFFGAAGVGMTCLYFFCILRREEYLERAINIADKILEMSNPAPGNGSYTWELERNGFGHGHSGLAFFYLTLFRIAQIPRYLEVAESAFKTEIARSYSTENTTLYWQGGGDDIRQMPYFRIGSAGIGSVACRMYETTKNPVYYEYAKKIANGCSLKYSGHPGLFTGIAGIGEFFLDFQQFFQTNEFDDQLENIVDCIKMFTFETELGLCTPSESLTRVSFDYGTGSSGIAHFIHRLINPGSQRRLFDIEQSFEFR